MGGERETMSQVALQKGRVPDVASLLETVGYTPPPRCGEIVFKPDFSAPLPPHAGVTTHPQVLEGALEYFQEHCRRMVVVESQSDASTASENFRSSGAQQVCQEFGARFVDLDHDILIPLQKEMAFLRNPHLPRTVLRGDLLVNLPVMKTHPLTTVSLGLMNLLGLLPGPKARYHPRIDDVVCDLLRILKPDLTLLDGTVGLEGAGSHGGRHKRMDLLLASEDCVSLDVTACRIMGVNPFQVEHIVKAGYQGLGESLPQEIEVVGEKIEDVRNRFLLP
jgi:uncharacterized protein (DUF362 family)